METVTINKNELRKIIRETVNESLRENIINILSEQRTYLEKPVLEAIETIAMANAIDEGMKSKTINKEEFLKKLNKKIATL